MSSPFSDLEAFFNPLFKKAKKTSKKRKKHKLNYFYNHSCTSLRPLLHGKALAPPFSASYNNNKKYSILRFSIMKYKNKQVVQGNKKTKLNSQYAAVKHQ